MTVVFPFHQGDALSLQRLLTWIALLGGCKRHHALLCADAGTPYQVAEHCLDLAEDAFLDASIISTEEPVVGWPQGPNALFNCVAQRMAELKDGPWLWLETDCIPLRHHWLELLEGRYLEVGKPILGAIVPCDTPGLPQKHVSGCAIYPGNFYELAKTLLIGNPNVAFDLAVAPLAVPMAQNDPLFHCFWGEKGLPPTFRSHQRPDRRPNEFTIDQLRPNAALFHRNKDGTLIELLKAKYFPAMCGHRSSKEFVVALPFSNKDAPLQIECLKWMYEMGQDPCYDCLLTYDHSCIQPFAVQMQEAARLVFDKVMVLVYPVPKSVSWPQAPNWAFQKTANHFHRVIKRAWLWKEPDMIPLKPDWVDQLQAEYQRCGKLFMGSVVPGMHHCNGTAVYPANTPEICPSAMTCVNYAFDTSMAKEMMPHCHDATRLMAHVWGMENGKPHPQVGTPIHFDHPQQVQQWVPREAVTFHRIKDTSLIQMLRRIKQQPDLIKA